MKKFGFFAAFVVAMAAVSCVQDINENAPAGNEGAVTFKATFDPATKAVLIPGAEESTVEWNAQDQVSVLVGDGNYLYEAASDGPSTTLTTAAQDVPSEGTYYALFPYDADATLAEGVVTTVLPSEQPAVLGSFTTHLAVAHTTDNSLAFKNVCGLVKVNIAAAGVTKIVFAGNSDEVVAGSIAVTVSDTPSWEAVEGQGATSVTLLPAQGQSSIAAGDYFFAVLPQTFEAGFKVTAYKGDDAWVIRNVTASTTIGRAGIVAGKSFFEIEGNGTEASPYILKTPEDLKNMRTLATLGGETWFKMANDINMEGVTGYVPVNCDNDFEREIHFDGGNFTISNFSCDAEGYNYPSLFGVLFGSCKDLNVVNASIDGTKVAGILGGYVGTTNKPATVTNVSVQGTVHSTSDRVGGVCGVAYGATFTDCSADVIVSSDRANVAGFAGKVEGESTFTRCTVNATVTSEGAEVGGFVGKVEGTTVFTDCEADVTAESAGTDLGGFAGKVTGTAEFTGCDVKAKITSKAQQKNRVGGLIGWNSAAETTITDCHVLEGTTLTDASGRTAESNGNYGGLIGFGDNTGSKVTIWNCTVNANIDAGNFATYNGFIVGGTGYKSTTVVENCTTTGTLKGGSYTSGLFGAVQGDLTVSNSSCEADIVTGGQRCGGLLGSIVTPANFDAPVKVTNCYYNGKISGTSQQIGGLVGYTAVKLEITNCYAAGSVTGSANNVGGVLGSAGSIVNIANCGFDGQITGTGYVGGIVGGIATSGEFSLERTYSTGTISASGNYVGGLIGAAQGTKQTVENCWSSILVTAQNAKQVGGLVGTATAAITITDSYACGDIKTKTVGAGITGRVGAADSKITGCIAWNGVVEATDDALTGAIVSSLEKSGTYSNCMRKSDIALKGSSGVLAPAEDEDITTVSSTRQYHGKAAAAGATLSSVAQSLGWSSDVWDFSEDIPTLKPVAAN